MPVEIEQMIVWEYEEAERLAKEALEEISNQINGGFRAEYSTLEKLITAQERLALLAGCEGNEQKAEELALALIGKLIRNEVYPRTVSATEKAVNELRAHEYRTFAMKYAHKALSTLKV